jgi:hypothetical protein
MHTMLKRICEHVATTKPPPSLDSRRLSSSSGAAAAAAAAAGGRLDDLLPRSFFQKLYIDAPKVCSWHDEPMPACEEDGVVVKTTVTCMSIGTELRCYRGIPTDPVEAGGEGKYLHEWVPFQFPYENGYSTAGRVVAAGPRSGFTLGDRVVLGTAHAEYTASAASGVWRIPDNVPDEWAVWVFVMGVGELALRRANPEFGSTIGIVGLGMVGLSALAYCRTYGFKSVAIDPDPDRRAMAEALGADIVLSPDQPDFMDQVVRFCAPAGEAPSKLAPESFRDGSVPLCGERPVSCHYHYHCVQWHETMRFGCAGCDGYG